MGHRVECPECGDRFFAHRGQHVVRCHPAKGGCGAYFNAHTNVALGGARG